MKQDFKIHRLKNGITLLGEPMDAVSSAAFSILVPVGSATDPEGYEGSANLLADMLNKGAGDFDSRQLSEELEKIGVQKSHSPGIEVSAFSCSMLGSNLIAALKLYGTVLLKPRFPVEELESVRDLALQDLKALEDEPASKVMNELSQVFYPHPFGRSQLGNEAGLNKITIDSLRGYYQSQFAASRVIIGVAGCFDWSQVVKVVESAFGGWSGETEALVSGELRQENLTSHIDRDTSQVQIAMAYPSVSVDHPQHYTAKIAVGVLSGGMAGRLFIEVREKRGLVYRVSASHSAAKGRAAIFASAGTTPDNAEETLSVMLTELRGVANGLSEEELNRAKADLKSRVIMQSEMSYVRCSALVNDWWNLQRLRTLDEIKQGIDGVTAEDIAGYAEQFPVRPVTLVTLGPKSLQLPSE